MVFTFIGVVLYFFIVIQLELEQIVNLLSCRREFSDARNKAKIGITLSSTENANLLLSRVEMGTLSS